jgi:hypothetical protein
VSINELSATPMTLTPSLPLMYTNGVPCTDRAGQNNADNAAVTTTHLEDPLRVVGVCST